MVGESRVPEMGPGRASQFLECFKNLSVTENVTVMPSKSYPSVQARA
jgi:hypothetical protein